MQEMATDEKAVALARLLASMVCALVESPRMVEVSVERTSHKVVLVLETADEDTGLVIGSRGRTISAMRDILYSSARAKGILAEIEYVNDMAR